MKQNNFIEMVKQDGMLLKEVSIFDQTDEICKIAVTNNWKALQFVFNQTEELVKIALSQNLDALQFVDPVIFLKNNNKCNGLNRWINRDQLAEALDYYDKVSFFRTKHLIPDPIDFNGFGGKAMQKYWKTYDIAQMVAQKKFKQYKCDSFCKYVETEIIANKIKENTK